MDAERRQAIRDFIAHWSAYDGNEIQGTAQFWTEFVDKVLGVAEPTRVFEFERKVQGRRIDAFIEDTGVLIEQKAPGVDLDKAEQRGRNDGGDKRMVTPYEQAKWYAEKLPHSVSPRWLLTCNFRTIRVYDLDEENPQKDYLEVTLRDLPRKADAFAFMVSKANSRLEREKDLSVQAGELVGRLRNALAAQYHVIDEDEREQRSLNMLVTRLVFLLYAEDAGLLQEHQAFQNYLRQFSVGQMRGALIELFRVLDTPDGSGGMEDERDPYLDPALAAFPYVNGGLFSDDSVIVPQFTEGIRETLLDEASAGFDWSGISPTIFGAAFESSLNPEMRHAGGMHYTSIENIHKVIDPLFLDDLKVELAHIEGEKVKKQRNVLLRQFQRKLGSLTFLDPAMGSGNFLTETYVSLRKLELRVIEDIQGDQTSLGLEVPNPIMVNIGQFYGIEVNDFAVSVAKTALWIAEQQMLERTQELLPYESFEFLPLRSIENLHEGNALRMDWNDVLLAEKCDYVIGNPPFYGGMQMSRVQKQEVADVFSRLKGVGELDYVAAWFELGSRYVFKSDKARCAFVSTNSICQGLSVGVLWKHLVAAYDIEIDFAWKTFAWNNEASDQAHVHVVIVGFSPRGRYHGQRKLFKVDGSITIVSHIDGYLLDMPDVYVTEMSSPLSDVHPMRFGSMPRAKGFTLTPKQREEFIRECPECESWIRPYWGAAEFLNGKERYCLWLVGVTNKEIAACPCVEERVEQVRQERLSSKAAATRRFAETPTLFAQIAQPEGEGTYLLVPCVSSQRRRFVPMAIVDNEVIASNLAYLVPDVGLYELGVMSSTFHNAWIRVVAGRLKSDYRYAKDLVYNTFVWPGYDEAAKERVRDTAQGILDARANHPGMTLAQLYDPDKMPGDLRAAHAANDAAVEEAYGVDFQGDEEKIVSYLFKLYAEKAGA